VRFWGELPLVREPDIALFGLERLDPSERDFLESSPIRRYTPAEITRRGAAAAAAAALERIHAGSNQFVLHLDVDAIAGEDFSATDLPGSGGLRLDEVRQALEVFVRQKNLAALEVTEYNPERDSDARGAHLLVELLSSVLAERLRTLTAPARPEAAPTTLEAPSAAQATPLATGAGTLAEALETPPPALAVDTGEAPPEAQPAMLISTEAPAPVSPEVQSSTPESSPERSEEQESI
jgi:hypothetical protein